MLDHKEGYHQREEDKGTDDTSNDCSNVRFRFIFRVIGVVFATIGGAGTGALGDSGSAPC
jgi:hypothetical protein